MIQSLKHIFKRPYVLFKKVQKQVMKLAGSNHTDAASIQSIHQSNESFQQPSTLNTFIQSETHQTAATSAGELENVCTYDDNPNSCPTRLEGNNVGCELDQESTQSEESFSQHIQALRNENASLRSELKGLQQSVIEIKSILEEQNNQFFNQRFNSNRCFQDSQAQLRGIMAVVTDISVALQNNLNHGVTHHSDNSAATGPTENPRRGRRGRGRGRS